MSKKLGFGLMRLPSLDANDPGNIDFELVKEMVDYFIQEGFTYFDTAWMYCKFQSEIAAKVALVDRYPRDAFTLTDKLHSGYINTLEDRDIVFNEQKKKTGVEFFDYYLLHDVNHHSKKVYDKLDCWSWIQEKKASGEIKVAGFSFHDDAKFLDEVLTEHPEMELVQLQINYLDWDSVGVQSKACYEVAKKHGKKVIVMEPVKGGTLVNIPAKAEEKFKSYDQDASLASWAIRFVASLDNVMMVLSGMGNMDMIKDNVSYMKDFKPLNKQEQQIVKEATDIINESIAIACTGCSYCTDGCPMSIAIPRYFSLYNAEKQEVATKGWTPQSEYYKNLTQDYGKASECIGCGQCEQICPQHLPIIEHLKEVADLFE